MVKSKAREVALEKLNEIKSRHSKMDNTFYVDLEIQEYLKDKTIRTSMARSVFKFKTRMANFSEISRRGAVQKHAPCAKNQMLWTLSARVLYAKL